MAKDKAKSASSGLKNGLSSCESASQKDTKTHKSGGNQTASKGSDRI